MHLSIRATLALALAAGLTLAWAPPAARGAPTDCAIDYDGDQVRTVNDFLAFLTLWNALSSDADLNGDQVIDGFDVNTFTAYFGFAVCPWKADYQYNRVVDTVDGIFFQALYSAGSLRADVTGDGVVTTPDFAAFATIFGTTY